MRAVARPRRDALLGMCALVRTRSPALYALVRINQPGSAHETTFPENENAHESVYPERTVRREAQSPGNRTGAGFHGNAPSRQMRFGAQYHSLALRFGAHCRPQKRARNRVSRETSAQEKPEPKESGRDDQARTGGDVSPVRALALTRVVSQPTPCGASPARRRQQRARRPRLRQAGRERPRMGRPSWRGRPCRSCWPSWSCRLCW